MSVAHAHPSLIAALASGAEHESQPLAYSARLARREPALSALAAPARRAPPRLLALLLALDLLQRCLSFFPMALALLQALELLQLWRCFFPMALALLRRWRCFGAASALALLLPSIKVPTSASKGTMALSQRPHHVPTSGAF